MRQVPRLREQEKLDAVIVDGDNAAGGFGITPEICRSWFDAGVDIITGGDHIWDQKEIVPYIAKEKRLLRPLNFPSQTPGAGVAKVELENGKTLIVIHALGQVFHREHLDCPFVAVSQALEPYRLGRSADAIFVDFHAEATSEKNAMGHYLDGQVSAVVGTHTHIPTSDTRILPKGTAYQTDAGMCGDYDSVIGFHPKEPLERFLTKMTKIRLKPANGKAELRGVMVQTDPKTGLAAKVEAVRY